MLRWRSQWDARLRYDLVEGLGSSAVLHHETLEVGGTWVGGAAEEEHSFVGALDEGLDGVGAEVGAGSDGHRNPRSRTWQ